MALGYCMVCKTLRTITRLSSFTRDGAVDYGPVRHDEPPTHANCGERVYVISEDDVPNLDGAYYQCVKHGLVPEDAVKFSNETCRGSRKAIR